MSDKLKIFVVDDEERNLKLMEAMLVPLGYEVHLAVDGQDALDRIRDIMPDLLLLDVMMPRVDGFEVARQVKDDDETKTIPVVMVTALSDISDRIKALEAGADDFLSKPVDLTELRARVASLLKVKAYNDYMKNYQKTLEEEVRKRTKELQRAYSLIKRSSFDTIYRLTRASEYKDEDTGAHIIRMSNYSAEIARAMNLSDTVAENILYSAPMHDVGKIGIPDAILLKPGKLNDEEWKIMKQHTAIGGSILEGSEYPILKMGHMIAMNHHEKWDGTGYPAGKKGREIPLAAQIVSVSDVFDALTSKRPYKEAWPLEKSYDTIRSMSGSSFNPAVVDAFFSITDKIESIKEEFSDESDALLFSMMSRLAESTV